MPFPHTATAPAAAMTRRNCKMPFLSFRNSVIATAITGTTGRSQRTRQYTLEPIHFCMILAAGGCRPSSSARNLLTVLILLSFPSSCQPIKIYTIPRAMEGRQHKNPTNTRFQSLLTIREMIKKQPVKRGASITPIEDRRQQLILASTSGTQDISCFFSRKNDIHKQSRYGKSTEAKTAFPCQIRTIWKFPAL